MVIVGSCKGTLTALDAEPGEVVWQYDITADGEQSNFHGDALVTEGMFLIGTDGMGIGHLYAFDLYSGEVIWKYPDGRGVSTDIQRHGDTVIAGTDNNMMWRIDQSDGSLDTLTALTKLPSQTMVLAGGYIFVLLDWTLSGSEIAAIDLRTGKVAWRAAPEEGHERTCARPYLVGESIVVGCDKGHVRAFEGSDGTPTWNMTVDGTVRGMGFSNTAAFIGTLGGTLYRVDFEAALR